MHLAKLGNGEDGLFHWDGSAFDVNTDAFIWTVAHFDKIKLIFDSWDLQAFDRKHESALEKRRGTTFGVRLAGSGQAAGS